MFETIAWVSLALAFLCAAVIAAETVRHPQKMGVMNMVWPVTALYASVIAVWAYFRVGRRGAQDRQHPMPKEDHMRATREAQDHPRFAQIAVAASHCGAGCALGDVAAEFLVFTLGLKLWGSELWASFVVDFVFAWVLGIVFQYFSIVPMRGLKPLPGIWAAIKADTLSITGWQLGMYGFMLLSHFVFFAGAPLTPNTPQYWLMMQVAMIAGFFTAYPVNYLLVKTGWKEAMG